MASNFIKAALVASVFTSSAGAAVAGDLGAALVGGIIGGVFMNEVNKNKQRTRPRLPSTDQGRQIQSSLNYFGFNAGTVDGQLGRKSKTAISQYQAYIGYPSTGALNDLEFDFLTSSYQRAIASGPLATQQAMGHPDGTRGLLRIYMQERLAVQQQQLQQQQQVQQQQMLQYAGQQPLGGATQYGVPNGVVAVPTQQGFVPQQGIVYAQTGQPQAYVPQGQQQVVQQGQQQMAYAAPQMAPQAYRPQAAAGATAGMVPQQLPQQGQVVALQQPAATTQSQAGVFAAPAPAQPQSALLPTVRRRALIVGVDSYDNLDNLHKARNDAQAVSNTLMGIGFEVTTLYDSDRREINSAVSSFANQIEPGEEVIFYFAGHGVEVDGRNYLLPSDVPVVNFGDESFLTGESIAADRVLQIFQRQGARSTVMILDACRNNPFPRDGQRSVGGTRGLVRMEPPEGSFILYSAGAGQTALDRLSDADQDPNSVFTRALIPLLQRPDMTLHTLAKEVRRDVQTLASKVNHDQFPAYYDQMSGEFRLTNVAAAPLE
ncbi:caspase family protein [Phaeobacter sp. B1627]|uniref:caspase family protein n=1 Tax=Phaeobacter sp. B1627 TaxID=2583809 RepID=UPI00111BA244|nr:caspase family protein [Phaeobacter sp. B1627]TNJ41961.1 peptidase C14 [Phaeobacter sp. B1627]